MEVTFTALLISSIVGFVLSFLVENIPSFAAKWAAFKYKGLAVAGSGLVVCIALVILSYVGAPVIGVPKPFIWAGLSTALGVFVAYLMATQTAYQLQSSNLRRRQVPQHDEGAVVMPQFRGGGNPPPGDIATVPFLIDDGPNSSSGVTNTAGAVGAINDIP